MSEPKPVIGVVGASARAAVHSLARAGYAAWAVDLFADRDLARVAPSARCPFTDYPHALPALAGRFPPDPVLYTGGLENHPAVVAALADRRPLWGNPPAVLEVVRDPFFPSRVWPRTDMPVRCPRVLPANAGPPDGSWLLKPRTGAGGDGIRPYHAADPPPVPAAYYLQEFVPGEPMSALFGVASDGLAHLLAVTEQLVGEPWLHAGRYQYAGNIGPVALPLRIGFYLQLFGRVVAKEAGLVGLFGIDFVLAAGVVYPVEINPRYPASAEVVEFATGQAVMRYHAVACGMWPVSPRGTTVGQSVGASPPFPLREGGPGGLGGTGLTSPLVPPAAEPAPPLGGEGPRAVMPPGAGPRTTGACQSGGASPPSLLGKGAGGLGGSGLPPPLARGPTGLTSPLVPPAAEPAPPLGGEGPRAVMPPGAGPRTTGARQSVGTSPPFPPREGGPGGLGGSGLRRVVGKAVYYAPHALTFPAAGPWDDAESPFDPWTLPEFADIPGAGAAIERGWPVLTFFAAGSSAAEVRRRLQSRAADLDRLFARGPTP